MKTQFFFSFLAVTIRFMKYYFCQPLLLDHMEYCLHSQMVPFNNTGGNSSTWETKKIISFLEGEKLHEGDLYTHDSLAWMYVAPVLIVAGLIENCLSVAVLSHARFAHVPSRATLVALAIVDCVVLLIGLGRYWLSVTFRVYPVEWSNVWCKTISTFVLFSSHLSSCLVALLSVERFFAVRLPHKQFRPSIDKLGTLLLFLFCFGVDMVHLKYTVLQSGVNRTEVRTTEDTETPHLHVCTSESEWVAFWQDIADILLLFGLPYLIIVCCNTYIIITLRRRSNQLNRMSICRDTVESVSTDRIKGVCNCFGGNCPSRFSSRAGHSTTHSSYKDRNARITFTLLCVTFTFLLCNLPFAVVHILRTADNERRTEDWNIAWLVTYILVYVNNCLNFPIYVLSHPQFREELKTLLSFVKNPCN